jgi:plasmid maintenance system killer protein
MPIIYRITERKEVLDYLRKRGLIKQYKKSKMFLMAGNLKAVKFKKLQPKAREVWSFRINKQFRAIGVVDFKGTLRVMKIDNHQ